MAALLLLGISMVILTVFFWYKELQPFLENRYVYKRRGNPLDIFGILYSAGNNFVRFFYYGRYFILDLLATGFLVSMLGFGDAVTGGILGLTMSNALSILILYVQKSSKNLTQQQSKIGISNGKSN
ncbi:MAG: hypothetical protein N2249_05825 [Melioribacter sp.]|nr:hypothetical protein [Melioribacter sp.]